MITLDAEQANDEFAEAIERVVNGKERALIQRQGATVAVLIPIEELAELEGQTTPPTQLNPGLEPVPHEDVEEARDTGAALLAMMEELWKDVPDEEWEKLPTDLAEQHDHYIYGTPKRQR